MRKIISASLLLPLIVLCVSTCNTKNSSTLIISDSVKAHLADLDHHYQKVLALKNRLFVISEKDQKCRSVYDSIFNNTHTFPDYPWAAINKNDSENQLEVLSMVDTYGWLSTKIIGEDEEQAIFLVIQHAPLKIQFAMLPLLENAVKNGDAPKYQLAFLFDRILMKTVGRQIFGTQYSFDYAHKTSVLWPLLFPGQINELRRSMGMCDFGKGRL